MPDYIVFMLRLQSGPETSPCPHPSNTMCMIRVQQRPPMEEKNATAEFWVRFPNKECIRTMHLLQAPRLRVAVQLLFKILFLEFRNPKDAIPPCVSYKPFVCVLPCKCCFDSLLRNEMLRVYWLLIWVVRVAARATRAARDNAACNSQDYSFNKFSLSVEIV